MDIRGRPLLERPPPLEHEGAPTTGAAPPLEHAGPGGVPGGRQGDGLCRKVDFSLYLLVCQIYIIPGYYQI